MEKLIHETAVIDTPAQIGEGTRIWHFSHVMKEACIGTDCNIGQNVFIGFGVRIGDRVKIQNNVSVYSGVEIGDDVFLGPSCGFTNVQRPSAAIEKKDQFATTRVKKGAGFILSGRVNAATGPSGPATLPVQIHGTGPPKDVRVLTAASITALRK